MKLNRIRVSVVLILTLFFTVSLSTAFSQTTNAVTRKPVNINGEMAEPVDWVYFMYQPGDSWVKDSTRVVNGKFSFKASIPDVSLARLWIFRGAKKEIDFTRIFLEPGNITLRIKDSLSTMKVEGSAAHKQYLIFNEMAKPFEKRQGQLYSRLASLNKTNNADSIKIVEAEMKALWGEMSEKVYVAYTLKNPESPIGIYVIEKYVGGWPYTTLERLKKVQTLYNGLSEATKRRPVGMEFLEKLNAAIKSSLGQQAIDFKLNDTAGRPVKLSSFRGKYVFIDFWASWCGPCRANNPHLVKAYHQFKDKDLIIMGIAFDSTNYKAWMDAIHTDKLPYLNLIDTTYPASSSVGKQYNIGAIPQNLLIDPKGKIVAKNIEGEELSKKLGELLN